MAAYSIEFKPSVEKDFRSIPKSAAARIWEKIEALTENPLSRGAGKLSDSEGLYRIRAGDYRIIYSIVHETHTVLIHYVRHRREAYRS
jgi:mRNA interferase RelE/StbE